MKKLLTFLALTISFSMNAQITSDGTDNSGIGASAIGFLTTASGDGSQLTNISSSSPFSLNPNSGNGIQSPTSVASGYSSIN